MMEVIIVLWVSGILIAMGVAVGHWVTCVEYDAEIDELCFVLLCQIFIWPISFYVLGKDILAKLKFMREKAND